MKIVRCEAVDAETVASIERECIECAWSEVEIRACIESGDYVFLKAELSGETVGYVSFQRVPPEYNICNLAVKREFRRRGAASALIEEACDYVKRAGGGVVFLEVNENNVTALRLYEKSGFAAFGFRPRYYGDQAAITMKREIV